jgi:hypothetical protein
MWTSGTPPDPGMGVAIELVGGHAGGERDLGAIGETLTGVRRAPQEPPPGFDQVEPTGPDGEEDLLDTRMGGEPRTNGTAGVAGVAGEMVGDEVEVALRVVLIKRPHHLQIASGIACGRRLGADLPIPQTPGGAAPRRPRLDRRRGWRRAEPCYGGQRAPRRGRGEGAWGEQAQLVDAADRRSLRRIRGAGDDPRPCGAQSGSVLVAHRRVRRQRTPSARRRRRTWRRATWMPWACAAAVRLSSVQSPAPSSSAATSSLRSRSGTSLPGGVARASAMIVLIVLRSASVSRGRRPPPGLSPNPSTPRSVKAWRRSRTVCRWQPSSAAIVLVRAPSQLRAILRGSSGHATPHRPGHVGSSSTCAPDGALSHRRVGGHGAMWAWETSCLQSRTVSHPLLRNDALAMVGQVRTSVRETRAATR